MDRCAGLVIDAAAEIGAKVVVVSEYGLVPVDQPVMINQALRSAGLLEVRDGPYGEMLMPMDSRAFAVVDHQLAHVYVADPNDIPHVRKTLEAVDGIDAVVAPGELELDHPRSGELIALAKPNAWFVYYYWLDEQRAPDFARTVDIHRKPGYDPVRIVYDFAAASRIATGSEETWYALSHGRHSAGSQVGERESWFAAR